MIYSTAGRISGPVDEARGTRAKRALLVAEGRRHVVPPCGALVGRSRDCDVVLADANVSRRHAEVRPGAAGSWTIADLGSTNGVRVNGTPVRGPAPVAPGDRIEVGTVDVRFEVL
jgi:predicted component of type VI protein secretion system